MVNPTHFELKSPLLLINSLKMAHCSRKLSKLVHVMKSISWSVLLYF